MFEHRGAVLTPLGGGVITLSLIRPAHLALCYDLSPTVAVRCMCARGRESRDPLREVCALQQTISISAVCGRAWRTLNQ